MAWRLTVNGDPHTADVRQEDPVTLDFTLNERASARFTTLPGYVPARFSVVVAYAQDGTTPLFGGIVTSRRTKPLRAGSLEHFTDVECSDYGIYADWCYQTRAYTTDVTLKQVLQDLVADKLTAYGISLDSAQVTGPTLAPFTWTGMRVSDALRELSDRTGYVWAMSPSPKLRMFVPGTEPADYTLTDAAPNCDDCDWADTGDPPVNRVVVLCGPNSTWQATQTWIANGTDTSWVADIPAVSGTGSSPARSAYAFLRATGLIINGDTVVVGGKTYTFQTTLTNVDGNVKVGASVEVSLESLAAAISLAGGAGSTYALAMTVNASVGASMLSADMMTAVALTAGTAGNGIACTVTAANLDWVGEGTIPRATLGGGSEAVAGFGGTAGYVTVGGIFMTVGTGEEASFEWDAATRTLSLGTAATPGAGTAITLVYTAQGPFTVTATGAGSPVIERLVTAETITTLGAGQEYADSLLAQLGSALREVTVSSVLHGWTPGQALTVDLTDRGIDAAFSIKTVGVTLESDSFWRYSFTALETDVASKSYLQEWRDMAGGGSSSGVSVAVGGGGSAVPPATPAYLGGSRYHAVQV